MSFLLMSKQSSSGKTPKRYQKLTPEQEARLYGVAAQPVVIYPPVALPHPSSRSTSIDNQIDLTNARLKSASKVSSVIKSLGIRRGVSVRRIQVGLDFGTSTVKVMYRELGIAEPRVRLLNFNHGLSDYPDYCFPAI